MPRNRVVPPSPNTSNTQLQQDDVLSVASVLQCVPQRYLLSVMLFLCLLLSYASRNSLNMALVEMVADEYKALTWKHLKEDQKECPGDIKIGNMSGIKSDFNWDEKTQGFILSSYYYGYLLSHLLALFLAERIKAKQVIGLGLLCQGIFSALIPAAALLNGFWVAVCRFFGGISAGPLIPWINVVLAHWAPPFERGRMVAIVYSGVQCGNVIGNVLHGVLIEYYGWHCIFYMYGICGLIWYILWFILCYSDPSENPFMTVDESVFILFNLEGLVERQNLPSTPWGSILKSLPVWSIVAGQLGHDWSLSTMQIELPKYMTTVLKFPPDIVGVACALPFFCLWIVLLIAGFFNDYIVKGKKYSITIVRNLMACVASFGPGVGFMAASYLECRAWLAVGFFSLGSALMGFFYVSVRLNIFDMSPNYAGTVTAFASCFGAISGILSPTITGFLVEKNTIFEWRKVFILLCVVITVSWLLFLLCSSAKLQKWNNKSSISSSSSPSHQVHMPQVSSNVPVQQIRRH